MESGEKRQTIRRKRKDGRDPKPGQILYHYTGMRTKSCRKLREDVCTKCLPILIGEISVVVGGKLLTLNEKIALAKADGFEPVTAAEAAKAATFVSSL